MERLEILVKKLSNKARIPTKAYEDDAAWDLYSAENVKLLPRETKIINTDLSMAIPIGWYGSIRCRSSLGIKGMVVTAGVIDSTYRGPVRVVLINISDEVREYKVGEKIAQLNILPVPSIYWTEVENLSETTRGSQGFGSTGR